MSNDTIKYRDRQTGEILTETVLGEKYVRWAYQDGTSKGWKSLIFRHALLSRMMGWYFDSRLSRRRIQPTIDHLGIDPAEFRDEIGSYRTFNAFFTRHLKPEARPYERAEDVLVAPADGRLLVYDQLDQDVAVPVKGARFGVHELLGKEGPDFSGGTVMVVRLCPSDYHRFHFPCAGRIVDQYDIDGAYHSVNPIALWLGLNVFQENRRASCLLETERYGTVAIIEVGAFGVGSIVQTYDGTEVEKMDEKGYFTFGGSTQILAFQRGRIKVDGDLIDSSKQGIETLVKVGERLGELCD